MALLHTQTVEKTFAGGSKTAKFVNVFSIECFVLYSMHALKSAQTQQYDMVAKKDTLSLITFAHSHVHSLSS